MTLQPPRGTHDRFGDEMINHRQVTERARLLMRVAGYQEIETPLFEFTHVFHRLGETSDVVSKETYTFTDRGGDSLTLRPEGTASVMRAVLTNGLTQDVPLRFFYLGPMFRYERPQKGRYRQFDSLGVELIGAPSPMADVEVMHMAHQLLAELDLGPKVALEINTLGDMDARQAYQQALVDHFSKASSDLSEDSQRRLNTNPLRILDSKSPKDAPFIAEAPKIQDHLTDVSRHHFDQVCHGLTCLGIPFTLNPHIVRGLDYYCHTTFEFTTQALGAQSAVIAGGRYDGLSQQMGGPSLPSVGWGSGIDRLRLLLTPKTDERRPLTLMVLNESHWPYALGVLDRLRRAHVTCIPLYATNLSKALKRANKYNAIASLIIGDDEHQCQRVTVRTLDSGTQEAIPLDSIVSYVQQHFIYATRPDGI